MNMARLTVSVVEEQERTASWRYSAASSVVNVAKGAAIASEILFAARASSSVRDSFVAVILLCFGLSNV